MGTTFRQQDPGDGGTVDVLANVTYASDVTTATLATVTAPAGAAGVRNVCNFLSVTLACGATAQTPIKAYLRDGASGVGAILWEGALSAPVNQSAAIIEAYLNIPGSPATAMTLEFSGAGVAASQQAVTLGVYQVIK